MSVKARQVGMNSRGAACFLAAVILCTPAAAGDCMMYEAGPQAIEGSISILEAYDAADRPETALILTPFSPTCLDAKDPDDNVLEVKMLHIYSNDPKIHEQLKGHVGETILVWGLPFPAHTAHHHAPVVMEVTKIPAD